MLVTVGWSEGETTGKVADRTVYHASLSPADYATILQSSEMRLTGFLVEDPDCASHTVLMARKDEA